MAWHVEFYDSKVTEAIHSWPAGMQSKFLHIVDLIELSGPRSVGMPHIKSLSQGLYEIRVKSNEGIARALFCIKSGCVVIVLSGFIKKTQKTPRAEIEAAYKRIKEVKEQ